MKTKMYLRVARGNNGKAVFSAARKPTSRPLTDYTGESLPTIAFAIAIDVPDASFDRAAQVIAELTIPEALTEIAADVAIA